MWVLQERSGQLPKLLLAQGRSAGDWPKLEYFAAGQRQHGGHGERSGNGAQHRRQHAAPEPRWPRQQAQR